MLSKTLALPRTPASDLDLDLGDRPGCGGVSGVDLEKETKSGSGMETDVLGYFGMTRMDAGTPGSVSRVGNRRVT